MKCSLRLFAVLPLLLLAAVSSLAQAPPPVMVSSIGYLNGTPQTIHTSNTFNSVGATTLVAFVSTNTPWNGMPVSIGGVTDNLGNTWSLLTAPTTFVGSSFTLVSAVYYVNGPATSATHTVTTQLSNPAPLVFHVFAVSGSDVSGPPISSAITDPGAGGTSANVTTAPVAVPTNSLLLSWVKNETGGNATALNGFTLDAQSTSFLWAESESPLAAGSYTGAFQYDSAIGWQAAIVALKPSTGPVALGESVATSQDTAVNITLTATSPQGFPLTYTVVSAPTHGTLTGSAPNLTYTPNAGYVGTDVLTFRANDGTTNSNTATVSITVRSLAPFVLSTVGYINGTPLTTHTTNTFNSTGASTLVAFVSSHPTWNSLPVSINGLTDSLGNSWTLLTGPTTWIGSSFPLVSSIYYVNSPSTGVSHTVTALLSNPAPLVLHVFAVSGSDVTGPPISSAITDPGPGGSSANVTTAPISVPTDSLLLSWVKNETGATATALNGFTLDAQSVGFLWAETETPPSAGSYNGAFQYDSTVGWQTAIVGVKPNIPVPTTPVITSTPSNPTNDTSANFTFTDTDAGVTFTCQLDGSAFSACSSPATYSGLSQGSHAFSVRAQNAAGTQSAAASFSWTIGGVVAPTVSTVSPNNGPSAGGTGVTIIGTNFAAGATVAFGATAATNVVVLSATQITATTPAGSAGAVTVTVSNPGGQSGSLASAFTYIDPPTVSSVSPNTGSTIGGTVVTITGTNFATGATVTFGSTAASNVVVVNGTTITATTPAGSAGAVTVTVSVNGQSGSLSNAFTYIVPPTVIGVSPNMGSTTGGTAVTITGTNFAAGAAVTFGSTAASNVVVVNGTTITATTPAGSAGAVTVTVSVNGQSGSLSNAFTYIAPPTVIGVSPNTGSTIGGTVVTITGTNFATGATVKFGSAAAGNVVVVNGTTITATTPAGSAGAVTVTVSVNGQSASLANGFTYVLVPKVSSVSPNTGSTTGGTAVTITGTNFVSGATVTFGGTAATAVVVVNGTTITAKTAAHAAGAVTVTVSNPGGQSGSLASGFTYVLVPTVSSVSPNTGSTTGGTAVTITGTNFAAGATVTFGGTAATSVVVVNGTKITAITAAHAAGAVTVTVTNPGGQSGSLASGFTYVVVPTVSSMSPNYGPVAGGTVLAITGTNFASGATVTFGSTAATLVVVVNGTTIIARTPAHAAGAVAVTVTNPSGQSGSLANGFTYVATPTVGSVSPNTGSTTGGTAVTITGTHFVAGAAVTFGGTAATNVVVVNGTTITARTPAHAAGAVTVTVSFKGQSGSRSNGFTYQRSAH